ncbi:apolipoprotein L6-like [Elgaria multicarinata webbii]|uniref:apolipoprotein L6-like n=1 Tax=Elgaria multicarinata webbii TaxID=159646 RepID=UPI002FCCD6EE
MESSWLLILISLLLCIVFALIYLHLSRSPQRAMEPSAGRELVATMEKTAELESGQDTLKEKAVRLRFAQFLEAFPAQRQKMERSIKYLHEMADQIDKKHHDYAITGIFAKVSTALSEGFKTGSQFLASSSATTSLGVAIAGSVLELVGTVTEVGTNVFERQYKSEKKKKAEDLMKEAEAALRMLMEADKKDFTSELPSDTTGVINDDFQVFKMERSGKDLYTNTKAWKRLKANPKLNYLAMKVAAGQGEMDEVKEVWKTLDGTPFTVTEQERWQNAVTSVRILLKGICDIDQALIHLKDGAKDEMAANIRGKAKQLAKLLWGLSKIYKEMEKEDITEEES